MSEIKFTETMNEISGLGGYYERCCRAAVVAGAKWCLIHPDTYGHELVHAICKAEIAADDGQKVLLGRELTDAQILAALYHLRFIARYGWEEYADRMSAPLAIYGDDGNVETSHAERH